MLFFFFSSRRRHTRFDCDWSSDVCSSDLFKTTEVKYSPHPVLERALDVLFILHADHEQNCSTSAMRGVGSSHPDPYSCMAAAAAALYGPLHGGANEAVLKMLRAIGSTAATPASPLSG